jgi:hypothetical protein
MSSCVTPSADADVDESALGAAIAGSVTRNGSPLFPGYVRLHDSTGEFVAEVALTQSGQFRFFARAGEWELRILARGTQQSHRLEVTDAGIRNLEFSITEQ